jgi:hypothetical protein
MAGLSERTGKAIFLFFLIVSSNETALARSLRGTIKEGKYIAPYHQFSFPVQPEVKVEDRLKVIPVTHFYERAFYPVPEIVEIPHMANWFSVSFRDNRGLSNLICTLPIRGDSFTSLAVGLHRRTAQRFLQDIALPELRSSFSKGSWLSDNIEYLKLDDTDAIVTLLNTPPEGIKGVASNSEGTRLQLTFGVLVFIKRNCIYMLVQSLADYTLSRPEYVVDFKGSLQVFYRSISFNSDSSPTSGLQEGDCLKN